MVIHVLIENAQNELYKSEHGLSLHIVHNDKEYLLDTGATDLYAENAKRMGIDLQNVSAAMLSHGHYDHSGGFASFIRQNDKALIFAMEGAMGRFASDSGGVRHEIGVPETVKEALAGRVTLIREVTEIAEGVTLVPHNTAGLEAIGKRAGLYRAANVETDNCTAGETGGAVCKESINWMPDDFAHEMSVVFESEKGLVICNNCSHAGLQNIVEEVKAVFPGKTICAYVGGLHMKGKRDGEEICTFTTEEVKALTDYIKAEKIELLYTGHCTGMPAFALLEESLGTERIRAMSGGDALVIQG